MRDQLYYRDRPSLPALGCDGYAYRVLFDIDQDEFCPLALLRDGVIDSSPMDLSRYGVAPEDDAFGGRYHCVQVGTSEVEIAEKSRLIPHNGLAYLVRFRLDAVPDLVGVVGPRMAHEDDYGICDFVYGEQPFEIPVEMMEYAPIDLEDAETRQWRPLPCFQQDMEEDALRMAEEASAPQTLSAQPAAETAPWSPKMPRRAWLAMMRRKGALQSRKAA